MGIACPMIECPPKGGNSTGAMDSPVRKALLLWVEIEQEGPQVTIQESVIVVRRVGELSRFLKDSLVVRHEHGVEDAITNRFRDVGCDQIIERRAPGERRHMRRRNSQPTEELNVEPPRQRQPL